MISYNKYSLKVEEMPGTTQYYINEQKLSTPYRLNVAQLQDEELTIFLYFNNIEDLFTRDYELMIQNALDEVKKERGFFGYNLYFKK